MDHTTVELPEPGDGRLRPQCCLEDLPEQRRDALLWHFAWTLDYHEVDDLVRERSPHPCIWPGHSPTGPQERVAVLGDDGRYHLLVDGQPICIRHAKRCSRATDATLRHEYWCRWWSDGTRYLIRAPKSHGAGWREMIGHRKTRWDVTLIDITAAPDTVAKRDRCPVEATLGHWPPYVGQPSRMARLITTLMDALGPHCHACGRGPGVYVDHDHFTGYVRGLVCIYCNTHVDECPHPAGCRWADYLNDPPAGPLQLKYPKVSAVLRTHQRRIDYLGIDPFTTLRAPSPNAP